MGIIPDRILAAMNRRHTRRDYLDAIARLRSGRADLAFTSDFIVGFPGEIEADFRDTLTLIDEVGFAGAYSFIYSPRPGTPAARMPQVARGIVKDRARRLREKGSGALRAHLDSEVGARRRVLAESSATGRTEQFTLVGLKHPAESGRIVDVTISGHDGRQLLAA